jgi:predicted metalloprotease
MRWFGGSESNDYEEGSSSSGGRGLLFGGGIVGLIGAVIYIFTGINPAQLLSTGNSPNSQQINTIPGGGESREKQFARVVFQGTTIVWDSIFQSMGKTYQHPILHTFTDAVDAAGCGYATSATGPFYCPADGRVYLDLSFFGELEDRFGAAGESARAYVIAHEVGHHIQNLLGVITANGRSPAKYERARLQ